MRLAQFQNTLSNVSTRLFLYLNVLPISIGIRNTPPQMQEKVYEYLSFYGNIFTNLDLLLIIISSTLMDMQLMQNLI